jgi:hypothetical protein
VRIHSREGECLLIKARRLASIRAFGLQRRVVHERLRLPAARRESRGPRTVVDDPPGRDLPHIHGTVNLLT